MDIARILGKLGSMLMRVKINKRLSMLRHVVICTFILFFSLTSFFSAQAQLQATGGTGKYRNSVYWLDFTGLSMTAGQDRTFTFQANGVDITVIIDQVAFENGAATQLIGYRPGQYFEDKLPELYNIGGVGNDNTMVNALATDMGGVVHNFRIRAYATVNGQPTNIGLVFGNGEADMFDEYAQGTTDGEDWKLLEMGEYNADSLRNIQFTNNNKTVSVQGRQNIALLYSKKALTDSANPLTINTALRGNGRTAIVLGIISNSDRGDAPATYGNASHALTPLITGGENPGSAADNTVYFGTTPVSGGQMIAEGTLSPPTTPKLGAIAGDFDPTEFPSLGTEADADNLDGENDEDGIATFPPLSTDLMTYSVTAAVENSSGSPATLVGWIDFNRNGTFEESEGVAVAVPVGTTSATLTWNGLSGLSAGKTYARFRISDNASLTAATPIEATDGGEVEDYTLDIIQEQPAFDCVEEIGYLIQDEIASAYEVNLVTGVATLVKSELLNDGDAANRQINGIGYNVTDNYIWGQRPGTNQIVRIGSDWSVQTFPITGLPTAANLFIGDVSPEGVLYLYGGNTTTAIYRVDVNPSSTTYLQLLPNLTTTSSNIFDWAFSPIDGNLYAMSAGGSTDVAFDLIRFNVTTGARTIVGNVTGGGIQTDNTADRRFGAVYMDNEGGLFVSNNESGKIYRIRSPHTGGLTAEFISNGPTSSFNDGARCPTTAVLPVPPTAVNDTATTVAATAVSIPVLANDSIGGSPLDSTTVRLIDPTSGDSVTTVTVANEGTYEVDSTGAVTFTPAVGFTGTTTPINYVVSDEAGTTSNPATITVTVSPGDPEWPIQVTDDPPQGSQFNCQTLYISRGASNIVGLVNDADGNPLTTPIARYVGNVGSPNAAPADGFGYWMGSLAIGTDPETGNTAAFGTTWGHGGQSGRPIYKMVSGEGTLKELRINGTAVTTPDLHPWGGFAYNSVDGMLYGIVNNSQQQNTDYIVFRLNLETGAVEQKTVSLPGATQALGSAVPDMFFDVDGAGYLGAKTTATGTNPWTLYRIDFTQTEWVGEPIINFTGLDSFDLYGAAYLNGFVYLGASGGIIYKVPFERNLGGIELTASYPHIENYSTNIETPPSGTPSQDGFAVSDLGSCALAPILETPPVAVNDSVTTAQNTPVTIPVLANDSIGGSPIDSTSVKLIDPASGDSVTTVTVANEGTYEVNPTTGEVIFTPVAEFTGTTAPVEYTVADVNGVLSNRATIIVEVTPEASPADIGIVKMGPVSVAPDSTFTYTLLITNAGPGAADGAIVTDPEVANFTATSISCAAGSGAGGAAACPIDPTIAALQGSGLVIPTLPSGSSISLTITGTAATSGAIANVATVTAPTGLTDPNPDNNTDTSNTAIDPTCTGAETIYSFDAAATLAGAGSVGAAGGTVNLVYSLSSGTAIPDIGNSFTIPLTYTDFNQSFTGSDHQWAAYNTATADWDGTGSTTAFSIVPNTQNLFGALPANNSSQRAGTSPGNTDNFFTTYLANGGLDQLGTFDVTIGALPAIPDGVKLVSESIRIFSSNNLSTNGNGSNQAGWWMKAIAQGIVHTRTNTAQTEPLAVSHNKTYTYKYSAFTDGSTFPNAGGNRGVVIDLGQIVFCTPVDGPTAVNDSTTTNAGTAVIIPVLANDSIGGSPLDSTTVRLIDPASGDSVTTVTVAGEGVYEVNPTTGDVTFTPEDGFTGVTTPLTYTVSDENGVPSNPATIIVTVLVVQPPFNCQVATGYLFQGNPTDAYVVNLATGETTLGKSALLGTTNAAMNALGYNVKDNYLWAAHTETNEIVRVGSDWSVQTYPIVGIPASNSFNVGDVNADGVMYFYQSRTTSIYRVDLDPASATYLQSLPTLTTTATSVSDWAFSPIDGNLYGMSDNIGQGVPFHLFRFDATTGVRTDLGVVSGGGIQAAANLAFGAAYMDSEGNLYVSNNETGNIYQIASPHTGGVTASFVTTGPTSGNNDGARCPTTAVVDVPPTTVNDSTTTAVGVPVTIPVLANDSIGDNPIDSTSVKLIDPVSGDSTTTVTVPNEGVYVVDPATGTVTFTPETGFTGVTTPVEYTVADVNGRTSATATITVTVVQGPTAVNDTGVTAPEIPVVIPVLTNDSIGNAPLDSTSVKLIDPVSGDSVATVTVTGEGTYVVDPATGDVTFTPEAGFTGTTTPVEYTVADENRVPSNPATITVIVSDGPAAVDDTTTTAPDTPVIIPILDNDTPGGTPIDSTTVAITTSPTNGTVVVNPDGTVTYTPNPGYTGPDTFEYTVDDENGLPSNPATVTVTVGNAPTAVNDTAVTAPITPVIIPVLANDSIGSAPLDSTSVKLIDPVSGDSVTTVTVPNEGVYEVNPTTGDVTFTPEDGFTGATTPIEYTVADVNGVLSNPATIIVAVNNAIFTLTKVVTGTVPDTVGGILRYNIVAVNTGNVTLSNIVVTDDNATITGGNPIATLAVGDSATVTAEHILTAADLDSAKVVNQAKAIGEDPSGNPTPEVPSDDPTTPEPNDPTETPLTPLTPPTAVNDSTSTTPNTPVTIPVLTNDTEGSSPIDPTSVKLIDPVSGDSVTTVTVPNEGTYVVDPATGDVTFTPEDGFTGATTPLTYVVSDENGVPSNPATITVTVSNATFTLTKVVTGTVPDTVGGILRYNIVAVNTGNVTLSNIVVTDDNATITGGSPIATLAVGDSATVTAEHILTAADLDSAKVINQAKAIGEDPSGNPTPEVPSDDPTTPEPNDPTETPLTPVTPPTAANDSTSTTPGTPVTIPVLTNDTEGSSPLDPTSVKLIDPVSGDSVTTVTVPNEGTYVVDPATGEVTFTPEDGFTGATTPLTYVVSDENGVPSNPATIGVTVNDAIFTLTKVVTGTVPDTVGGILHYNIVATNTGNVTLSNIVVTDDNATITGGSPIATLAVGDSATVTAEHILTAADLDSAKVVNQAKAIGEDPSGNPIPEVPSDDPTTPEPNDPTETPLTPLTPPTAVNDSTSTTPNTPVTIPVLTNDSTGTHPIDPATVTITTPPTNGTVTVNPDGTVEYTPNPDFTGPDTFEYTVDDEEGNSSNPATVTVTVNDAIFTLTKVVTGTVPDTVGGILHYNIVAVNTGNVALSNIVVTDDNATITGGSPIATLAVGDSATVTAEHILTAADLDSAKVVNQAKAIGEDPSGNPTPEVPSDDPTTPEPNDPTETPLIPLTPPTAVSDSTSTTPNTPVTIPVLTNDSTGTHPIDPATVTITTPPTNGTVTVNPDGTVEYTPNPGFTGPDTFEYTVDDEEGNPSNPATVTVTVNDAIFTLTKVVTGTVPDTVGGILHYNIVAVNTGNVALSNIVVTDDNATITGGSPIATLAVGDSATVTAEHILTAADLDSAKVVNQAKAIGEDPSGNPTPEVPSDDPTTPEPNDPTETPLTPLTPPTAVNDSTSTTPNTPVTIPVLTNDTEGSSPIDPTSVKLIDPVSGDSVTTVTVPNEGTYVVDPATGEVTFTPEDGFTGATTPLTYVVSDENGVPSNPATISVTVSNAIFTLTKVVTGTVPDTVGGILHYNIVAVNTGNVALSNIVVTDDNATITGGSPIATLAVGDSATVTAEHILTAADLDSAKVVNQAKAIGEDPSGNPTPEVPSDDPTTPEPNDPTETPLTPLTPPTAANDSTSTTPGTPVTIPVLTNDTEGSSPLDPTSVKLIDPVSGDSVTTVTVPNEGTYVVDPATGEVTFTPEDGFTGATTPLTYVVSDENGVPSNPATVTVTVNDAIFTLTKVVTGTVPDTVGGILRYNIVAVNTGNVALSNIVVTDDNATITGGSPIATLAVGDSATVTAEHILTAADLDSAKVVNQAKAIGEDPSGNPTPEVPSDDPTTPEPNDPTETPLTPVIPPTAVSDSTSTTPNTPVTIPVLTNDSTGTHPIDPATVTITTPPTNGTVTVNPDGTVEYTPNPDFTGPDTFEYTVDDEEGNPSNPATVTVTVSNAIFTLTKVVTGTVPDTVGGVLHYNIVAVNTGNVALSNIVVTDDNATITGGSPIATLAVGDSATVTAEHILTAADLDSAKVVNQAKAIGEDPSGNPTPEVPSDDPTTPEPNDPTETPLIPLTPPTAVSDSTSTTPNTPVTIPVLTNDSTGTHPIDPATVTITTPPTNGTVTVNPDGTVEYTPNPDFTGPDTFEYTVDDEEGNPSNPATVTVTVNDAIFTLTKVVTGTVPDTVGGILHYNIVAVNTGNVALSNIVVTDDNATITGGSPIATLAVGDSATVTAEHILTAADLDSAKVVNQAKAIGEDPSGNPTPEVPSDDPTTPEPNDPTETPLIPLTPPTAVSDSTSTTPNTPVTIPVLTNDSTGTHPIDPATVTITTPPTNGTVTVNPDGTVEYTPNPDFTGPDTFEYTVDDEEGNPSNPATVTVTVNNALFTLTKEVSGTVPNTVGSVLSYNIVVTNTGNVALSNIVVTDDNATITGGSPIAILAVGGSATVTAEHILTAADLDSTKVINQAKAIGEDPSGNPTPEVPSDDPNTPEPNDPTETPLPPAPPVAVDDQAGTTPNTPVTIPVLENDSTGTHPIDPVTVTITTPPTNGTVKVNPDGTVEYTPNPDFTGEDSFEYTVDDEEGNPSNPATVTVRVNEGPTAVNDEATTDPSTPVIIPVLTNDKEGSSPLDPTSVKLIDPVSGDSVATVTVPNEGVYEVNPTTGDVTFTPEDGFTGATTPLTYVVSDENGVPSNPATITVTVNNATFTLTKEVSGTVPNTVGSVLSYNIVVTNTGNVALSNIVVTDDNATITGGSPIATLAVGASATVTAEHILTAADLDSTKVVNQAKAIGEDPSGNPTPEVPSDDPNTPEPNDPTETPLTPVTPPRAVSDSTNTTPNTPVTIPVLENDSTGTHPIDPATVTIITPPTNGTVTVNPDGTVTYTPEPGYTGPDTFEYTVDDEEGNPSNPATVIVTVNEGPTAVDDHETTRPETLVNIPVLSNDKQSTSPLDLTSVKLVDPLQGDLVNRVTVPGEGTYLVNPTTGVVSFTPVAGFSGTTTPLGYRMEDQNGGVSNIAYITVTIETGPTAVDDQGSTLPNTPVTIPVLTNDKPGDSPIDPSTVTITTPPTHGTVKVNPDGTVLYTPNPGYTGPDAFEYTVEDDNGVPSNPATVVITVNPPTTPPTAVDDNTSTNPGIPVTVPVLTNDKPGDSPIDPSTVTITTPPTHGTVTVNPDGTVVYTPEPSYSGPDTFEYTVDDEEGTPSNPAKVIVTVNPPIAPPIADDDETSTDGDTPVIIPILDNDTEGGSPIDPSKVKITKPPVHGTVTVNPDGTIIYTPTPGYSGPDEFEYTVEDEEGNPSNPAKVKITVHAGPRAVDDEASTTSGTPVKIGILDNDTPGSSPLNVTTVEVINAPQNGNVTVNPDGTTTYTSNGGFIGTDRFTYQVKDERGMVSNVATVIIDVKANPLFIPNFVTPNGDGRNDLFEIGGAEGYERIEVFIFNRWGDEVYNNPDYKNNWDGRGLNEGTYYYLIKLRNGGNEETKKGWILLKRQ